MLNPFAPDDVPDAELAVLIWNDHWYGSRYETPLSVTTPAGARIDVRFTRDRSDLAGVDGVVIHAPTLRDLPPKPASGPPWVMASMEAYDRYTFQGSPAARVLFDLTMTHRLDSDVPTPYANRRRYGGFSPPPRPPQDPTAPISFLASHEVPERDRFVRELMDHIPVASYGARLTNREIDAVAPGVGDRGEQAALVVASHPVHLAFENICEPDYVTEKLYRPLAVGTIPVYRGAPNVAEFLPSPDAAVVVHDDTTPAELAAELSALVADPDAVQRRVASAAAGSPRFGRLLDLGDVDPRARLATKLAHGCDRDCGCGGRNGHRR